MKKLACLWLAACALAFAGRSFQGGTGIMAYNYSIPNPGSTTATIRTEIKIHDWSTTDVGYIWISGAFGTYAYLGSGTLQIYSYNVNVPDGGPVAQCTLPVTNGHRTAYIRIQQIPSGSTSTVESEVWDYAGAVACSVSKTFNSVSQTGTSLILGNTMSIGFGFWKVFSSSVPMGSTPPTNAGSANTYINFSFDSDNLVDSSSQHWCGGSACSLAMGGSNCPSCSATFVDTPDSGVVAVARVFGAPSQIPDASIRAGHSNQLDGNLSFSQDYTSITCLWSASGPSVPSFSDATSCSPTVTGLIFGEYSFTLAVTDGHNSGNSALTVGAVVTDDNWVVQNTDPNVDVLLGPMIAYGHNPWGYADWHANKLSDLRYQQYVGTSTNNGNVNYAFSTSYPWISWNAKQTGTVSYLWDGRGMAVYTTAAGTTLNGAITGTSTTITVHDISKIDYSELPTRVYISNKQLPDDATAWEEVRICSVNVGANQLIVCGTGAGRGTLNAELKKVAAQSWPDGTRIGQFKLTGTGTSFLTTLVGSSRVAVVHFARPFDGTDAYIEFGIFGVESDTSAYLIPGYDPSPYGISAGASISNKYYSYIDNINLYFNSGSYGGISFYAEDLANWALYYRSGLSKYKLRAKMLSDVIIKLRGLCQQQALYCGGEFLGGMSSYLFSDTSDKITMTDLRPWAQQAVNNLLMQYNGGSNFNCAVDDSRDLGYMYSWISLLAYYDTDSVNTSYDGSKKWNQYWLDMLDTLYTAEYACRTSNNDWASPAGRWGIVSDAPQAATFTNGSRNATITTYTDGFTSSYCDGILDGTGTVTAGSNVLTWVGGDAFAYNTGYRITVSGTKNSGAAPFTMWVYFTLTDSTHIKFYGDATWFGDTGSVTWMISNRDSMSTWARSLTDYPNLYHNWDCRYIDANTLRMMRNWNTSYDGAADSTYYMYKRNAAGFGQQPYMMSIRMKAWNWGEKAATKAGRTTTATNLRSLRNLATTWQRNVAYTPMTGAFHYFMDAEGCTPQTTGGLGSGACWSGNPPDGDYSKTASREVSQENGAAVLFNYEQSGFDPAERSWGDLIYGGLWGVNAYNNNPPYNNADQNNEASANAFSWQPDGSGIWYYGKALGFFHGVGASYQWPAYRYQSGIAPTNFVFKPNPYGGRVVTGGSVVVQ